MKTDKKQEISIEVSRDDLRMIAEFVPSANRWLDDADPSTHLMVNLGDNKYLKFKMSESVSSIILQ